MRQKGSTNSVPLNTFTSISWIKALKIDLIPYQKKVKSLPNVLSRQEVARIIAAAANLKNKAIIQTLYATGVRLSELINLKVTEIDSNRMVVMIGKHNC